MMSKTNDEIFDLLSARFSTVVDLPDIKIMERVWCARDEQERLGVKFYHPSWFFEEAGLEVQTGFWCCVHLTNGKADDRQALGVYSDTDAKKWVYAV